MDLREIIEQARDVLTVRCVYGEPFQTDGMTLIPVARVQGGGGGGEGQAAEDNSPNRGSGGGFGLNASPVGAFVIRDGDVRWQPTVDVNRILLGGQVVAIVALLTLRRFLRSRRRR